MPPMLPAAAAPRRSDKDFLSSDSTCTVCGKLGAAANQGSHRDGVTSRSRASCGKVGNGDGLAIGFDDIGIGGSCHGRVRGIAG